MHTQQTTKVITCPLDRRYALVLRQDARATVTGPDGMAGIYMQVLLDGCLRKGAAHSHIEREVPRRVMGWLKREAWGEAQDFSQCQPLTLPACA